MTDTVPAPAALWPQPLHGVRVLDFSLLLPGPYCTHLLTEMGAETVKVEPPGGDPARAMNPLGFATANRGKQSVCVDLADPASREFVLRLAEDCDVVVEGFRPGVMARLGLSFEQVRERNPHVVYVSISAYGHTGPYAPRPAHDVNIIAAAGYFATTLDTDHATLQRPRVRIADYLSGLQAAFHVAALMRTPRPQRPAVHVDASMFDAMAHLMLPILQSARPVELDDPVRRADVLADVALYRTADGHGIAFATLEDKFWLAFAEALGERFPALRNPRWLQRRGRTEDKQALQAVLTDVFRQMTLAELEATVSPEAVCWNPVVDGRGLLADPHVAARGLVRTAPDGRPDVSSPVAIDGVRSSVPSGAPALGEHTAAWRERLGLPG